MSLGSYRLKTSSVNKNPYAFMLFAKAFFHLQLFSTALALRFLLPNLLLNLDLHCGENI